MYQCNIFECTISMNKKYVIPYLSHVHSMNCFNWIDSSTMARQKNETKTGSSKHFSIQIVNNVMLLMLLKKVWLCAQQAGRLPS